MAAVVSHTVSDNLKDYLRNGYKFDIVSGGSDYVYFITGDYIAHMLLSARADGDTEIEMFEQPTVSDNGTGFVSGNFNFNNQYTGTLQWFYTPTVTDEGTHKAFTWAFGGSGTTTFRATHVSASIDKVEVLTEPNKSYLIKFTNHAERDLQIFFEVNYYETTGELL